MAGRHAFSATSSRVLSDSKLRSATAALAFGAMFGAALPVTADKADNSGAQALAELTIPGEAQDGSAVADTKLVITGGDADLQAGQLVVEDTTTSDNVELALSVEVPVIEESTPAPVQNTTAASTAVSQTAQKAAASAPAPAAEAGSIIGYARQFTGTPYVWGGTTPAGFDCSGFVGYVYAHFGYSLPRTVAGQASVGHRISAAEAQPGDLVVWGTHHVGLYTGNGQHIAARNPGTPLAEGPLYGSYYFVRIA